MKLFTSDMHTHPMNLSKIRNCVLSDEQKKKFDSLKQIGFSLPELSDLETLTAESASIEKTVALALDKPYNGQPAQIYIPNVEFLEAVKECPSLLAGISINPERPDAIEELDKLMALDKECKIAAIKWLPNSMQFNPSDKRFIPFYRKVAEYKLPIISHTGNQHVCGNNNQSYGDPALLRLPLEEGVIVVGAHSGVDSEDTNYFKGFEDMLRNYSNLYGDLSALAANRARKPEGIVYLSKQKDLHSKLLQGSDFPLLTRPEEFKGYIPEERIAELVKIANPLEKDFQTKKALGFEEEVFTAFSRLYSQIKRN